MNHIVLAGDSIFDNGAYIEPGEPNLTEQVESEHDANDRVTLLAMDGDTTKGVSKQLERLPVDATHLFISVGGNDALNELNTLRDPVTMIGEGFLEFHKIHMDFEKEYRAMLLNALSFDLPTTICTIYHPRFGDHGVERVSDYMGYGISKEHLQKVSMTALPIFNDIIFQESAVNGIPIMDLRIVFNDGADYANPIEPSVIGGMKMAKIIKKITCEHDFGSKETIIFK